MIGSMWGGNEQLLVSFAQPTTSTTTTPLPRWTDSGALTLAVCTVREASVVSPIEHYFLVTSLKTVSAVLQE